MDDEAKELLREIRDLQKEETALYRQWHEQSAKILELREENELIWKQNQLEWQTRNRRSNKWILIIFGGWMLIFIVYWVVKLVKGETP